MGLSLKATLMSGALGLSLSFGALAAPKKAAPEPARAFFACAYQLDDPAKTCVPVELKGVNKNEDALLAPASLNKLMTAHLVIQHMLAHGKTLDSAFMNVTPADTAAGRVGERNGQEVRGGHVLALPEDHTLTYREAILALTVYSANNVAVACARSISPDGTQGGFIRLMNEEAQRIGMKGTTFKTASGMPATGQRTTAADMSTLVHHIVDTYGIGKFDELFGQKSATIAGRDVPGHLRLLRNPEVIGGKTGADNEGLNVAGFARKENVGIAFTTLGSPDRVTRDTYTIRMLDKIFGAFIPSAQAKPAPAELKPKAAKQAAKKKPPAKPAKRPAATKKSRPQP